MTGRHVEILEAARLALLASRELAGAALAREVLEVGELGPMARALQEVLAPVLERIDARLATPPEGRADLERAEIAAQRIARIIDDETPPGFGFILWLASFGSENGMSTYVASIERADAIRMLEEWIALQRGADMPAGLDGVDHVSPRCWCCGSTNALQRLAGRHRSVVVCRRCHGKAAPA